MTFWLLMLIPLLTPFLAKIIFNSKITPTEMGIQLGFIALACLGLWEMGRHSQTADTELWNGEVVAKMPIRESCPWGWTRSRSWFCENYRTRQVPDGETCTTDEDGNRSCTTNWVTEYNYDYEWEQNWHIDTNLGRNYKIARVDQQGAQVPLRWEETLIGDPVSRTNNYTNYVKAANNSLFNRDARLAEQYAKQIPEYPITVYDYYHVDRVLSVGVDIHDLEYWNKRWHEILKTMGPKKQANAVLLITNITDQRYGDAVINAWEGAKKNDIVTIIGVDSDGQIVWLKIHSWSKNAMFDIVLRDTLLDDVKSVNDADLLITAVFETTMDHFVRRPMAEFEYLANEIEPSTTMIIATFIILMLLSVGTTVLFSNVDISLLRIINDIRRR